MQCWEAYQKTGELTNLAMKWDEWEEQSMTNRYGREERCWETTRKIKYSGTPLIRTLVIRIANYPERLGPSDEHFLTVTVFAYFCGLNDSPNCQIHIPNYVLMLYLYVIYIYIYIYICSLKQPFVEYFSTSNCQRSLFSKKNQIIRIFCISGWLAVPINAKKGSSGVQRKIWTIRE